MHLLKMKHLMIWMFLYGRVISTSALNAPKVHPEMKQGNQLHQHEGVQKIIRRSTKDIKAVPHNFKEGKLMKAQLPSNGLSKLKVNMENRVKASQQRVNISKHLSAREKDFKSHVLEMFLEELRESERDMLNAEEALKKSLMLDFWNSSTLIKNSWNRLEALRLATLKEEKSYKRMVDFEAKMKKFAADTNSSSWMGEIIKEISAAADKLESYVAEHDLSSKDIQDAGGANIEAVVHVRERIGKPPENVEPKKDDGREDYKLDVLIDADDNKYILTKLNDPTSPFIDHILIFDVILVMLFAVPLGYICQLLGLPSLFGYVLGGLILGPSGCNWIQEMIQIESLGEFGVFMIMFSAGLEFSIDKIQKVWRVALQVPCLITLCMVFFGIVIGSVIGAPWTECAFVSVCLSLSSTPLVTKFIQGGSRVDVAASDYAAILMAVLVVQDVLLSFFISLLPGLAEPDIAGSTDSALFLTIYAIVRTLFSLVFIGLSTLFISIYVMPMYSRHMSQQTKEIQLLGSLTFMFLCLIATNHLGVSMELGCFAAGVMLSSSQLLTLMEKVFPLHDFLSVIFFASIGFHVFPSFVLSEVTLLMYLTAFVTAGKFAICLLVLRFVLPPQTRKLKWIVSSGLAQVSEFSFVMGSRARHLKIITREVYFLILSVTTLSLILAPVMWKLSLWRYRIRHTDVHIN